MPLLDIPLEIDDATLPADVRSLVREAERRIERFQQDAHVPGFVPSDFERAYRLLRALADAGLTSGNLFCEWGSGFGVIACLAAMLDFDAVGIEIEGDLVEEARRLADDYDLPVEFVRGSFIPRGGDVEPDLGFSWLSTDEDDTHDELGLDPDDFNVIFAYPWPDEEHVTEELFERYAGAGAVLVTFHGGEHFRVRRKKE